MADARLDPTQKTMLVRFVVEVVFDAGTDRIDLLPPPGEHLDLVNECTAYLEGLQDDLGDNFDVNVIAAAPTPPVAAPVNRGDAGGFHSPDRCWNVPAEQRTPDTKHCGDCRVPPIEAITFLRRHIETPCTDPNCGFFQLDSAKIKHAATVLDAYYAACRSMERELLHDMAEHWRDSSDFDAACLTCCKLLDRLAATRQQEEK